MKRANETFLYRCYATSTVAVLLLFPVFVLSPKFASIPNWRLADDLLQAGMALLLIFGMSCLWRLAPRLGWKGPSCVACSILLGPAGLVGVLLVTTIKLRHQPAPAMIGPLD